MRVVLAPILTQLILDRTDRMRARVEFSITLVCICIVYYSMLRVYETAVYLEETTPDGVFIKDVFDGVTDDYEDFLHCMDATADGKC